MNESKKLPEALYVFDQFMDESDRASVILVAAAMDKYLNTILKAKLVQVSEEDDPLLDSPNAPMKYFGPRINFAYRLGLISEKLCKDMHIIRKIRNEFSHDVFNCNFDNQSVKGRILNLKDSFADALERWEKVLIPIHPGHSFAVKYANMQVEKQNFLLCATLILASLDMLSTAQIKSINQAKEEWCYTI